MRNGSTTQSSTYSMQKNTSKQEIMRNIAKYYYSSGCQQDVKTQQHIYKKAACARAAFLLEIINKEKMEGVMKTNHEKIRDVPAPLFYHMFIICTKLH